MSRFFFFIILIVSIFSTNNTLAGENHGAAFIGDIKLSNIWLKAPPQNGKVLSGYLTINNMGEMNDRLVSINSEIAMRNEIHEMKMDGDVMSMRPLTDGVEIEAGSTVNLKPGGIHLMIMGVEKSIKTSDKIKFFLKFLEHDRIASQKPGLHERGTGGKINFCNRETFRDGSDTMPDLKP